MNVKIIIVLTIFSLMGCVIEPFELKFESENSKPVNLIKSPCTYNDTIKVNGVNGCYGKVDAEIRNSFDYHEARARWYTSAAVFVIRYHNRYGFDQITDNTEYDLTKSYPIQVILIDYGIGGKTYTAKSGSLFMTRLPNGKLRADWCNIILKDENSSLTTTSWGGFQLP